MASLTPLPYELDAECPVGWSDNVSLNAASGYPFLDVLSAEDPNDFAIRAYLETLWLPDAIAPLSELVPTMQRVIPSSPGISSPSENSSTPLTQLATSSHPLIDLVIPLLMNVNDIVSKYRQELPALILSHHQEGGVGNESLPFDDDEKEENVETTDPEEAMMAFAWQHEKVTPEKVSSSISSAEQEDELSRQTAAWLKRYERREALIQVLLHFLYLSLPSPLTSPGSDKKRKRAARKQSKDPAGKKNGRAGKGKEVGGPEHDLDVLMDRLSIWREADYALSDFDDFPGSGVDEDEMDWLKQFCETVVKPNFSSVLPKVYEKFQTKCFPASLFESDSEPETLPIRPLSRSLSRHSSAQPPQPASLDALMARDSSPHLPVSTTKGASYIRARSASIGPAAPGQEMAGGAAAAAAAAPSRTFTRTNSTLSSSVTRREVSMRRSVSVHRDIKPDSASALPPPVGSRLLAGRGPLATGKVVKPAVKKHASLASRARLSDPTSTRSASQPPLNTGAASIQPGVFVPDTPANNLAKRTFGRSSTVDSFRVPPQKVPIGRDKLKLSSGLLAKSHALANQLAPKVLVQETPVRPRSQSFFDERSQPVHFPNILLLKDNLPDEGEGRKKPSAPHKTSPRPTVFVPETPLKA